MKTTKRFFFVTLVLLVAYVLSACGGLPQQAGQPGEQSADEQAAIKVNAVKVAYTGVIEAMNGAEWTVNGQPILVDPSVVNDGPFQVGDTVKVEGEINPDGTFNVSRVEAPSAEDLIDLPQLGDDNANENSNDDNSNDGNANDDNSNDANDNDSMDDNSNDDASNSNVNSNGDDDDSNDNSVANSNDDDGVDNSNDDSNEDDDSGSSDDGSNDNDDDGDDSGGGDSNGGDDDNGDDTGDDD